MQNKKIVETIVRHFIVSQSKFSMMLQELDMIGASSVADELLVMMQTRSTAFYATLATYGVIGEDADFLLVSIATENE